MSPQEKELELVLFEEDIYDLETLPNLNSRTVLEWKRDGE